MNYEVVAWLLRSCIAGLLLLWNSALEVLSQGAFLRKIQM